MIPPGFLDLLFIRPFIILFFFLTCFLYSSDNGDFKHLRIEMNDYSEIKFVNNIVSISFIYFCFML